MNMNELPAEQTLIMKVQSALAFPASCIPAGRLIGSQKAQERMSCVLNLT